MLITIDEGISGQLRIEIASILSKYLRPTDRSIVKGNSYSQITNDDQRSYILSTQFSFSEKCVRLRFNRRGRIVSWMIYNETIIKTCENDIK